MKVTSLVFDKTDPKYPPTAPAAIIRIFIFLPLVDSDYLGSVHIILALSSVCFAYVRLPHSKPNMLEIDYEVLPFIRYATTSH